MDKLKNKINILNEKLEEADKDISLLEKQISDEQHINFTLNNSIQKIENENKKLEDELSLAEERYTKNKNDIIIKDVKIKSLESKIAKLEKDFEQMIKEYDDKIPPTEIIKIKADESKISQLQKELDTEKHLHRIASKEVIHYKNEVNRVFQLNDAFERDIIELENKLVSLTSNPPPPPQDYKEHSKVLNSELYEQEIGKLLSQNRKLHNENVRLTDEIRILQKKANKK